MVAAAPAPFQPAAHRACLHARAGDPAAIDRAFHTPEHVVSLFAAMARTYGLVNLLASFGFSHRWRRACVQAVLPVARRRCADLMCGMGEATTLLATSVPTTVECFDFCPEMVRRAMRQFARQTLVNVRVVECDVLSLLREPAYDRIVCSFGLKTLDDGQLARLAEIVAATLQPGGAAAFVEIAVPRFAPLRFLYLAYLRYVIPVIGWLFLGNPACYRWLARYTEDFARRDRFASQLRNAGLIANEQPLFFGCAKIYRARKPDAPPLAMSGASAESHDRFAAE